MRVNVIYSIYHAQLSRCWAALASVALWLATSLKAVQPTQGSTQSAPT